MKLVNEKKNAWNEKRDTASSLIFPATVRVQSVSPLKSLRGQKWASKLK